VIGIPFRCSFEKCGIRWVLFEKVVSLLLLEIGMFWTAFIWGLGTTLGGSIGLMSFIAFKCIWDMTVNSKPLKRANELAELANAALVRRNELTEKQIGKLGEIVAHLDVISDAAEELADGQ
jgi:hypothetical protein